VLFPKDRQLGRQQPISYFQCIFDEPSEPDMPNLNRCPPSQPRPLISSRTVLYRSAGRRCRAALPRFESTVADASPDCLKSPAIMMFIVTSPNPTLSCPMPTILPRPGSSRTTHFLVAATDSRSCPSRPPRKTVESNHLGSPLARSGSIWIEDVLVKCYIFHDCHPGRSKR